MFNKELKNHRNDLREKAEYGVLEKELDVYLDKLKSDQTQDNSATNKIFLTKEASQHKKLIKKTKR